MGISRTKTLGSTTTPRTVLSLLRMALIWQRRRRGIWRTSPPAAAARLDLESLSIRRGSGLCCSATTPSLRLHLHLKLVTTDKNQLTTTRLPDKVSAVPLILLVDWPTLIFSSWSSCFWSSCRSAARPCFGGLLLAKALALPSTTTDNTIPTIPKMTCGVVFLSTPFRTNEATERLVRSNPANELLKFYGKDGRLEQVRSKFEQWAMSQRGDGERERGLCL